MTLTTAEELKRQRACEAAAKYRAKKKAEDPAAWSQYTAEASKRARERDPDRRAIERERVRVATAQSREPVYEFLRAYKVEQGCVDCGYNEHHAALDFDHITPVGRKGRRIGTIFNMERLQEELKLCVVRCRNCHAIRHSNEGTNTGRPRST